jgi:hypothetical protein
MSSRHSHGQSPYTVCFVEKDNHLRVPNLELPKEQTDVTRRHHRRHHFLLPPDPSTGPRLHSHSAGYERR